MFILFISSLFAALATVSKSNNLTVISTSSTPDSFTDNAVHLDNLEYESSTFKTMNQSMHNSRLTRRNRHPFRLKLTEIPSDFNSDRINSGIYGAKVKLGANQQELLVQIDLSSKYLWVKKDLFNVEESYAINTKHKIEYGGGIISGELYTASFTPGDWNYVPLEAKILLADVFPDEKFKKVQGILGLKRGDPQDHNNWNILDACIKAGFSRIFGLYFGRIGSGKSHLILGGVDMKFFQNQKLQYYEQPKNPLNRWMVDIRFIRVNLDHIVPDKVNPANHLGILDTIQPKILGPKEEVNKIYNRISHSAEMIPDDDESQKEVKMVDYSISCDSDVNISFNFGGVDYEMDPNHMKLKELSETRCLSAVTAITSPKHYRWILGIPFLRNVYTIFDIQNDRIGFVSLYRSTRSFFKETPGFDDIIMDDT